MCNAVSLIPIRPALGGRAIHDFDAAHPEYGLNDRGERRLALDTCIVPAVRALWAARVVTYSCCCLHGQGYGVITLGRARPA